MRRSAIAAAVVCVTLAAGASASAHVFTIRGDWKIGSFAVKRDGTLAGAIEAFGAPASRERRYREVCIVRWPRHGLRIVFYNLGGENPCRGPFGNFSHARALDRHWQTGKGLAIGDRRRRLRNLYPNAAYHPREPGFWPAGWWLVPRRSQYGTGGGYPGLLAQMKDRRVFAFHVRYPAGGD